MDETDEYCRPASLEELKALIGSLNRQQVVMRVSGGRNKKLRFVPIISPSERPGWRGF